MGRQRRAAAKKKRQERKRRRRERIRDKKYWLCVTSVAMPAGYMNPGMPAYPVGPNRGSYGRGGSGY
jgi:hypothetical protein